MYFLGIILLFLVMFFVLRGYLGDRSLFSFIEGNNPQVIVPTKLSATVSPDNTPGFTLDISKNYSAKIKTNKGEFTIDLFEKNAPNTVNSFVFLASQNYFNNTKFHRLIPGILLQGGSSTSGNSDPADDGTGGPGYVIADEINWDSLDYSEFLRAQLTKEGYTSATKIASVAIDKYRLAMASPGPNLNGSQYFIVLGDKGNTAVADLDGRHTVFAEVVEGKELIDTLAAIPVDDPNSLSPRPVEDIVINSVEIISQ